MTHEASPKPAPLSPTVNVLIAAGTLVAAAIIWAYEGGTLVGVWLPAEPLDLASVSKAADPSQVRQGLVSLPRKQVRVLGLEKRSTYQRGGTTYAGGTTVYAQVPLPPAAEWPAGKVAGLLVIQGRDGSHAEVTGLLRPLDAEVRNAMLHEAQQHGIHIAPVMLDTEAAVFPYQFGGVAFVVFVLSGMARLWLGIRGLTRPASTEARTFPPFSGKTDAEEGAATVEGRIR